MFLHRFILFHLSFQELITIFSNYLNTVSLQIPYFFVMFIIFSIFTNFSFACTLPIFLLFHLFSYESIIQHQFYILLSPSLFYPIKGLLIQLMFLSFMRSEPLLSRIIEVSNDMLYLISTSLPFSREILSFSFAYLTIYVSL